MIAYKIMERNGRSDNSYRTLFHSNFGSRVCPVGINMLAQSRENAKDGSSKTTYRSGWHVLPTLADTVAYLSKFTTRLDQLVILKVECTGAIWEKEHSPSPVLLAQYMKIIEEVDAANE